MKNKLKKIEAQMKKLDALELLIFDADIESYKLKDMLADEFTHVQLKLNKLLFKVFNVDIYLPTSKEDRYKVLEHLKERSIHCK